MRIADARRRHVFVRDLDLEAVIGVHRHEKRAKQPVRINLDLTVDEGPALLEDDLRQVVCYETLVDAIKALLARGHVNLVETLAEQIAACCLADPRVLCARVRVEKPWAIAEARSVGIEIERTRPADTP